MKRIAIYGAGGFGKEVCMLLSRIGTAVSFAGYIDDFVNANPTATPGTYNEVVVAVADPDAREKIFNKIKDKDVLFGTLIHPDVWVDKSNVIGRGSIICGGVQMTVNIRMGQSVIVNLTSTIGHDVEIGDFTAIMPAVNISGGVKIGKNVFIGTGATILQGVVVGDHAIIGAGAVVLHDVEAGSKIAGVPARSI